MEAAASASSPFFRIRRSLSADDLRQISELVSGTGYFAAHEISVAAELALQFAEKGEASGYRFLTAERSGEIVGYACFGLIPCTLDRFDLYWVVIRSDMQGQGFGRLLLRAVDAEVINQGGSRLYAETSGRKQYTATHRFYEKTGFALEARLKDFYAQDDDKLIYSKALK